MTYGTERFYIPTTQLQLASKKVLKACRSIATLNVVVADRGPPAGRTADNRWCWGTDEDERGAAGGEIARDPNRNLSQSRRFRSQTVTWRLSVANLRATCDRMVGTYRFVFGETFNETLECIV